jgi:hypothetical protein
MRRASYPIWAGVAAVILGAALAGPPLVWGQSAGALPPSPAPAATPADEAAALPSTSPEELARLMRGMAASDRRAAGLVIEEAEKVWQAADARKPLALDILEPVVGCYVRLGDTEKAQAWAMKAYVAMVGSEAARASVSPADLARLADLLGQASLTGEGKGFPGYAAVLARFAVEGTLEVKDPVLLADPLGTDEARKVLRDVLVDSHDQPRLAAAKILAVAYQRAEESGAWRSLLEDKISTGAGDIKALWLAAKAYTDTLVTDPPNPLRRKMWLDAALAAASSEPVRVAVLEEFVDFYRSVQRPGLGAELLESVAHQFGAEAAAKLDRLRSDLVKEEAARQEAVAQALAAAAEIRRQATLEYYQQRLTEAQVTGDAAGATRLKAAITELQKEAKSQ